MLPEVVEETEEDKDFIASEGSVEEEGEDEIDRLDQAVTEKVAKKKRKAAGKKDQSYSKIKKSSSKALEASGRFMKAAFPCIKSPQLANPSSKAAKPPACRKEKVRSVFIAFLCASSSTFSRHQTWQTSWKGNTRTGLKVTWAQTIHRMLQVNTH